jgi:adenosylcobinamide-GDP ribazoletransferase
VKLDGLAGAVQFLTRVPVRTPAAIPHERVVPWFPLVGAAIGGVIGGAVAGIGELVPHSVAAAIGVIVGLLITGAFHEDGLADVADAFGGGWTPAQRMEILKDSRHGTYGVAALASSIVIRIVSAAAITSSAAVVAAFVAAHTLGRGGAVVAMRLAPPAADSGLGVSAARSLRPVPTAIGVAAGVAVTAALTGWWVLPFLATAMAGTALVVTLAVRKIGGLAGDVLGAVEQVVECLVLVVASGLAAHHQMWWA